MNKGTKTITIVNAWHDDNKGDGAIIEATLTALKRRWPQAKYQLVSMLQAQHPTFPTAYRHVSRSYPELTILPAFVDKPEDQSNQSKLAAGLMWLLRLPKSLAALALPGMADPGIRALLDSSLIVANGGHQFYGKPKPGDWSRLYRVAYPLWLAQRSGIPYVMFAQSFGPFEDTLGRWVAQSVFANASQIYAREEISAELARSYSNNVRVVPDAAFALEPQQTPRLQQRMTELGLEPGQFWVVTVRRWYYGSVAERDERTRQFLAEMAQTIQQALSNHLVTKIVLVAHTQGPVANEDDRIPTRELAGLLNDTRVVTVEDDFAPRELAGLYQHAALVLGTRFHSVILALIGGTPAYAISYFGPKSHGIMRMLDMENLCIDMQAFSAKEVLRTITLLDLPDMRQKILGKVTNLQRQVLEAIDDFPD